MKMVNGLYQLGESIGVCVSLEPSRQGVIPAGTVFAVQDREGREASEDGALSQIDLAKCEFLCSLPGGGNG